MLEQIKGSIYIVEGLLSRFAWLPFLILRLSLGILFAVSGFGKLGHLSDITSFFASLGIPMPGFNAVFVSWVEFLGGLVMILGLPGTRFAALLLTGVMFVALITAHFGEVMPVTDLNSLSQKLLQNNIWNMMLILAYFGTVGAGPISIEKMMQNK